MKRFRWVRTDRIGCEVNAKESSLIGDSGEAIDFYTAIGYNFTQHLLALAEVAYL